MSLNSKEKAISVLSGGLDSTVALALAADQYDVILALTFNYGQRAFGKEIRASRKIAEYYGVRHQVIPLPWLAELLPQSIQARQSHTEPFIPNAWFDKAYQDEAFWEAKSVWVPNRNGLFLNIAATFAEALKASVILFGANAEEAERFPDNTDEFRQRENAAFQLSTLHPPRIECPVGMYRKVEIIQKAQELNVPLDLIWSCYTDNDTQCGYCPSCQRLKQALEKSKAASHIQNQVLFAH